MKINLKFSIFLIIYIYFASNIYTAPKTVSYTYGGNFKALIEIPKDKKSKKYPVIIYNYDEFLDKAGDQLAKKIGYNIHDFSKTFTDWGYISIIPLERYRKLNALKGAIQYIKRIPEADPDNINLIGLSEGGFLSLLAIKPFPKMKSITIISPQTFYFKGPLSLKFFKKQLYRFNTPIHLIVGNREKDWRLLSVKQIYAALKEKNKKVNISFYPHNKRWFWDSSNYFMIDIRNFIEKNK